MRPLTFKRFLSAASLIPGAIPPTKTEVGLVSLTKVGAGLDIGRTGKGELARGAKLGGKGGRTLEGGNGGNTGGPPPGPRLGGKGGSPGGLKGARGQFSQPALPPAKT